MLSYKKGAVYLHYTGDVQKAKHANTEDSEYAMGRLRDMCHRKNGQRKEGCYTFSDKTSYGVGPQMNDGAH